MSRQQGAPSETDITEHIGPLVDGIAQAQPRITRDATAFFRSLKDASNIQMQSTIDELSTLGQTYTLIRSKFTEIQDVLKDIDTCEELTEKKQNALVPRVEQLRQIVDALERLSVLTSQIQQRSDTLNKELGTISNKVQHTLHMVSDPPQTAVSTTLYNSETSTEEVSVEQSLEEQDHVDREIKEDA